MPEGGLRLKRVEPANTGFVVTRKSSINSAVFIELHLPPSIAQVEGRNTSDSTRLNAGGRRGSGAVHREHHVTLSVPPCHANARRIRLGIALICVAGSAAFPSPRSSCCPQLTPPLSRKLRRYRSISDRVSAVTGPARSWARAPLSLDVWSI